VENLAWQQEKFVGVIHMSPESGGRRASSSNTLFFMNLRLASLLPGIDFCSRKASAPYLLPFQPSSSIFLVLGGPFAEPHSLTH
jgi:hypothetical protein